MNVSVKCGVVSGLREGREEAGSLWTMRPRDCP